MTTSPSLDSIIATKADLADLVTKEDLNREITSVRDDMRSGFNLVMGEIGKLKAGQEEQNKILARIVAKLDGV